MPKRNRFHPIMGRLEQLPGLYKTDNIKGDLPAVYIWVAFTRSTWVLWEYDPETGEAFGLCDLGLGFPELGYVNVHEIIDVANDRSLFVMIDTKLNTRFAGYKNLSLEVPSFLVR
jgi:hypothetical protein